MVIISDFYEVPERIIRTIEPLRFHGNEVLLFHVLDPKEIRPQLDQATVLIDLESRETLEVSPEYAQTEYRKKMDAHIRALRESARSSGIDYCLLVTDRPLDAALREYLTVRQGRL